MEIVLTSELTAAKMKNTKRAAAWMSQAFSLPVLRERTAATQR